MEQNTVSSAQIVKESELAFNAAAIDPLTSSLVFLSKFYGKPFSSTVLVAGLPVENGRLTAQLFPRAAGRAGLDAKLHKKPITKISQLLLPCVLLLDDGRSAVLMSYEDGLAQVAWPELSDSVDEIELEKLQQIYSGYCFYVRKRYRFDARSPEQHKSSKGHWFWGTIFSSMGSYRDALLASLLINLFAIASPLFVMNVYDRVVPNHAMDTLWVLSIAMLLVIVFDFALKQARSSVLDLAAKKADVLLSAKLFEKVLNMRLSSRPDSVGAFARNIQEFESIRDFITSASIIALVDLPFAILFLGIIFVVSGPVVVAPAIAMLCMIFYALWIKRRMRLEVEKGNRFSSMKNAHLIETLSGIEYLKLVGAESQFQQRWEELVGNLSTWNIAIKKIANSVSSVNSFMQQAANVCAVIVGVYFITLGELSMGGMIAAIMLSSRALAPFSQVSMLATRYNQAKSALQSLDEIMAIPDENLDRYLHRPHVEGKLEFNHVDFTYPKAQKAALNQVSFSIEPKQKVAIIGRIGAGKSSIEKLIMGFYPANAGAIRIDGIDINQISPVDLRTKIGCLPQDIHLVYGSIRDNITLGVPHVEDELIFRAAHLAGVTQFTDQDPEGLDRQVGERGMFLSGGQRQAVALARALLFNPPMLILDEPTSSMDSNSEAHVRRSIAEVTQDRTTVIITHKSSMLELVDRIIVIEQGRIVADGPKTKVLEQLKSGQLRAQSE
ncbi:type I secretion system permease/ATPase [Alginatibacterium sediminis]|uniref:Type I secretion system permease/ATPase n=1 Tax=Alginatibacterium sediminis TaxID=2164068 RepID=A0A420E5V1_9ALTE|nr:type I secretion system permease/ATPase [Alginatibacterium sediminis]RKF12824.1 type I secretion system permease/ATPase [Alginatibacterium sediminis]